MTAAPAAAPPTAPAAPEAAPATAVEAAPATAVEAAPATAGEAAPAPAVANEDLLARLRRAHGQLGGLIHMVENGRECTEVLTLLAAVTHALHRAGFRLVAAELERALSEPPERGVPSASELEKLFVSLG